MIMNLNCSVHSRLQLSPSELRCSPHTTYYTNFFILRTAVTINGQPAEIGFSENKELTLNCRYPYAEYVSLTLHSVLFEWELVLRKYGVSNVSNFWCAEAPFFQIGFSSEHNLRAFLHSQDRMEIDIATILGLKGPVPTLVEEISCEVKTELFLVAPDMDKKDAQITRVTAENCSSCLAVWKESEVFEFGSTFRAKRIGPGQSTAVIKRLNLKLLISELSDVIDWFHLGLFLGVPQSELLTIEADHRGQTKRCKTEMLDWWMNNEEQPTWSAVVRALIELNWRGLAQKIAIKYAILWEPQSLVSAVTEGTNSMAESLIAPIQLPSNIQQMHKRLEKQDEVQTRISEELPVAKKRKLATGRKYKHLKKQMTIAQASKVNKLLAERNTARKQLEMKESELRFLKRLRKIEKKNDELKVIIANKEAEVAQLREQLTRAESELSQTRKEVQHLNKQLQHTIMELEDSSAQVREMERTRAFMERERRQKDMMITQFCAMSQKMPSPLVRVTPAEFGILKQAVEKKEEEIRKLLSQLQVMETEKQKLLTQVRQSKQKEFLEDQLVQLTAEISELRAHLVETEDGRLKAEIELQDQRSRMSVVNPPLVDLMDSNSEPCVERKEVTAELKSIADGCITQAKVTHQTTLSKEVSYKPSNQGVHNLSVSVNGLPNTGRPSKYAWQPPQLMGQPVRGLSNRPDPHKCIADGSALHYGQTNQIAQFQVHLMDANGELCTERQVVHAELKSKFGGCITQAEVTYQTTSKASYEVVYKPSIRGSHELGVFVNGLPIAGSPFLLYVQQPPELIGQPVRVIRGLNKPWRATFTSRSRQLLVAEYDSISILDNQSVLVHKIESFEGRFSRVQMEPTCVAIDNSDTMYVCDVNAHKLFKVCSTGKVLKSVGGYGVGPGQFVYPEGITLRDNKLYVCDHYNHRIQIFSHNLNFIRSFGSCGRGEGELSFPRDIAFDQEGSMYVVEFGNHRVQVFSPSGEFLRLFGKHGNGSGELNGPNGIHVDHICDDIFITEQRNNRVSVFSKLGEFITSFGSTGNKEGDFNMPCGITMDHDGYLYVCDSSNDRIQVF